MYSKAAAAAAAALSSLQKTCCLSPPLCLSITPILQPPLSPHHIPSPPYSLESPAKFNFILEAWIVFCPMTDRGQPGGESIGHGLSTEMCSPDRGATWYWTTLQSAPWSGKKAQTWFLI